MSPEPDSVVVAVDVGGTGIKAATVDGGGRTLRRVDVRTPVEEGPEAVVAAIRGAARQLADTRVVAAGVVVPGSVNVAAGVGRYSTNLGWRDVPLRDLIAADLGVPVVLEHDVRAAGLAERTLGGLQGVASCLLVVIGTGIAGVLVVDGVPVRGSRDLAGEVGHLPVHPDGAPCACGQRGCLETYASAAAIARRYASAVDRPGPPLTAREIAAAREVDPCAAQVWQLATDALAIALTSCTLLLDPQRIVLGGGLSEAGEVLRRPVLAALSARLAWRPPPELAVSPLGSRAGLLGAAVLAWRAVGPVELSTWTSR